MTTTGLSAEAGRNNGKEPWRSDGTRAGTVSGLGVAPRGTSDAGDVPQGGRER